MSDEPTMTPIPKGAFLTISTGAYSSYSVQGVFRAIETIDADALRTEYLTDNPDQRERYHFDDSAFLAWVARKGLIDPIPSFEWHLSDYSDADDMDVTGPDQ